MKASFRIQFIFESVHEKENISISSCFPAQKPDRRECTGIDLSLFLSVQAQNRIQSISRVMLCSYAPKPPQVPDLTLRPKRRHQCRLLAFCLFPPIFGHYFQDYPKYDSKIMSCFGKYYIPAIIWLIFLCPCFYTPYHQRPVQVLILLGLPQKIEKTKE